MTNHSPEPWCISSRRDEVEFSSKGNHMLRSYIVDRDGMVVVTTIYNVQENQEEALADLRRIAACVNACKGVPTEELEEYGNVVRGARKIALEIDAALAERTTANEPT